MALPHAVNPFWNRSLLCPIKGQRQRFRSRRSPVAGTSLPAFCVRRMPSVVGGCKRILLRDLILRSQCYRYRCSETGWCKDALPRVTQINAQMMNRSPPISRSTVEAYATPNLPATTAAPNGWEQPALLRAPSQKNLERTSRTQQGLRRPRAAPPVYHLLFTCVLTSTENILDNLLCPTSSWLV